jgi:hypothetical protein
MFRYEDYWLQVGGLVTITKERLSRGTRHMGIASKINHRLCMVRAATRAWLKDNIHRNIIRDNIMHVIQYFDAVEEWRILTDCEFALRAAYLDKLQRINSAESKHWRRRAKIKWCKLGDENTKFFHTMATCRYRKNKMKVLCHNGEEFFDDSAKIAIATNYFSRLFKEDRNRIANIDLNHLYSHSNNQLQPLGDPFSWLEIEQAIKKAPASRSPGPDGFTNEFFKFYSTEWKDDLMLLFGEFYSKTVALNGINLANIMLLPKNDEATSITDFRPVSLQHSIPKLMAKVLANRLQPRMKHLVDEMQSGFIKDRSIVKNFATAIEMIQCINMLKRPVIVLKLDFQKAFDSVHWDAIFETLSARGFRERWIWWVR